ncbi:nuclear pore complex protein [Actinidia rufa]|uniref:Nuclear pore complex protein n=1 Tax=Actinidia rufa TaxID=165716 RepID=A0A7J0E310_9ERIC|nr:nuclear pore complex protein [Actinidia rufa]
MGEQGRLPQGPLPLSGAFTPLTHRHGAFYDTRVGFDTTCYDPKPAGSNLKKAQKLINMVQKLKLKFAFDGTPTSCKLSWSLVENGNPVERKNWFPDIEPLFKLLSYENVPPYLKGALRNAIATFVRVSPTLKDTVWSYLEQYDLLVVVRPHIGSSTQPVTAQMCNLWLLDNWEWSLSRYLVLVSSPLWHQSNLYH